MLSVKCAKWQVASRSMARLTGWQDLAAKYGASQAFAQYGLCFSVPIWLIHYVYFAWTLFGWQNGLGPSCTKTVLSTVHMLSCLYCTIQLTDTSIASVLSTNQRGASRLPAHILLLELRAMGKLRKWFSYMIKWHLAHPCHLAFNEVCGKTTEIA